MFIHTSVSNLYSFDLQDSLRMAHFCRNMQEIIICILLSSFFLDVLIISVRMKWVSKIIKYQFATKVIKN
jgi:hypothetical protein